MQLTASIKNEMVQLKSFIEENQTRFLNELFDLLRIPSISTDPEYSDDVVKMAYILKTALESVGADKAEVHETEGNPIVFAEKILNNDLPTVLVYGHYDVQPPDPLELWETPPFAPTIRKTKIHPQGAIFARGACDDKGQLFMHVKALESMVALDRLPCNIKFIFEGEEEIGSPSLGDFCYKYKDKLSSDVILISDTSMLANDMPSITTGLRGLSYVEVEVTGPNRDLHSGVFGGAVANPLQILSEMITSLKDDQNQITIPGFYDRVVKLSEQERKELNKIPYNPDSFMSELGVKALNGEKGYTTLERTTIRPTLDLNGIWGGYIGKGAKTVLPSKAFAKISMRLVPDQDPEEITELFISHFKSIAPPTVKVKIQPHHGGFPAITPVDSIEYQAASRAMKTTFGKEPIPMRSGGSIPIVSLFEKVLNAKTVLMGFGLDSDDIHSPNEHFGTFNFFKGIETIPYFHSFYAKMKSSEF
jgi:acetylornithine deacetylase/succinyl-diaminopimelate desuccinylase-like protein